MNKQNVQIEYLYELTVILRQQTRDTQDAIRKLHKESEWKAIAVMQDMMESESVFN